MPTELHHFQILIGTPAEGGQRGIKMGINILVVDDEKELADILELYLIGDGYTVHKFYTGAEALDCIAHTALDLAILDIMLPDMDGFQICRKIREKYYYPVIMLTAKADDGDKIMGLRNCREIICIFLESMLIYVMNEFSDSGGHFHGT